MTHSHSSHADDIIALRRAPKLCTQQRGSCSASSDLEQKVLWAARRSSGESGERGGLSGGRGTPNLRGNLRGPDRSRSPDVVALV